MQPLDLAWKPTEELSLPPRSNSRAPQSPVTRLARPLHGPVRRFSAIRANRDRIIRSAVAGLAAAVATAGTMAWLSTPSGDAATTGRTDTSENQAHNNPEPIEPTTQTDGGKSDRDPKLGTSVDANDRILALDREIVPLPLSVGDQVELVGLRPSLDSVDVIVVAGDAHVVGFDDEVLLLVMEQHEAHLAVEIQTVGGLVVLGRNHGP